MKTNLLKSIFISLILVMGVNNVWGDNNVKVYCAIKASDLNCYTLKVNANIGDNGTWRQYTMEKLDETYEGRLIYQATIVEKYSGVDALQFQLYDGNTWKSQKQPYGSWTTSSTFKNKLYVYDTEKWITKTNDPSYTVYFVNKDSWTGTIKAYAWNSDCDKNKDWSGADMTSTGKTYKGKNIYSITLNKRYANIIFNNGSSKTDDLTLGSTNIGKMFDGSSWVDHNVDPVVTFKANGGTGNDYTQTVHYNTSTALTANTFTRTGYSFNGWKTAANGGTSYADKANVTFKANTTLYAQWTEKTYSLTFKHDGNGTIKVGETTVNSGGTASVNHVNTKTLVATANTGYNFSGWTLSGNNTSAVTIGNTSATSTTIKATNTGATVTANFTPITYNITYTAPTNGSYTIKVGNNAAVSANTTANYKTTITLTSNPDPGYRFSKWTITPNVSITNNTTFLMPANDVNIAATFEADTYTITWNANGGSVSPESSNYTYNGVPIVLPQPTRDGYTFLGWFTSANGGDKINDVGTDNKPTSDVEYFAQWEKNMYTVTYGVVGAKYGTIALNKTSAIEGQNTQNLEHGTELIFTAEPNDGYRVQEPQGWFSDEAGNTSLSNGTANTYTINSLTDAASVFVAFEKIPASTYIVTFDANGGSGTMNSQSFTENEPQHLTTNAFTRTGYTFAGWKTAADGTGDSYTDGQSVTLTTAGLTLYAQWTANQYTITLSQTGATEPGTASVEATFDAPMPAIAQLPTKDGYAFMGYFAEEGGQGKQYYDQNGAIDDINWDIVDKPTLYAHFENAQIALTLNQDAFESNATGTVDATYTITPAHAHNIIVCWSLTYSNDRAIDNTPTIEDNVAKFSLNELSAGSYKIVASLRIGNCEGDEVAQTFAQFTKVGNYSVTIQYTCEGEQIAAAVTQAGHPSTPNTAEAPTIGGYNFVKWVLGDGVTIGPEDNLENTTISYTVNHDAYLTATYEKKKLIFLDISTLPNKDKWSAPHVYLYNDSYWDETNGAGASGSQCVAKDAMIRVPNTTDMWYFEYEDFPEFAGYVAFTSSDKTGQNNFWDCEAIYRGDFSVGTPVFVPAKGQTANEKNKTNGKSAKYYNKGHWTKYMGGTGYTLKIYNHKEEDGRKELMSVPFTGSSLNLPFTAIVDLEGGQTFGYKIVRDNDKWYKNDANGTMTVNSHTNWPFIEDKNNGLACGIQTVAAGIYTFTLTLNATSGNFEVSVDYPVTVGDYRILYKDDTRTTYKPSDIKKAEELNPVTSFFIRPDNDPKLKVQTAARVTNEDITWFTSENEIFFKPNTNWKSDGARFAAYFYTGSSYKWVDLKANGDLYSCAKPTDKAYTHVIFCRMDPKISANNFNKGDGKPLWNQTRNLSLPTDGKNFYALEEGAWRGQIYLKPNSNWTADGARFAAYFFEKSGDKTTAEVWNSMYKTDDNIYWCDVPDGCSKVIFCRMNPNVQDNNWNQGDGNPFWGMQTNDLTIPTNANDLYTITTGQNKPTGSWSCKSWSKLDGSIIDLSKDLTTKLSKINATADAVYTIYLSANGASIEKVEPYTGNYYIRVDAADGKWYDYKTNPDNLMTYSAFSENEVAVVDGEATYKSPYSHYKTAWCKEGENVKFVIANDYSPCISDTLVQDSKFNNIDEHGNLKSDNGKYSANIRFMWNRKNNKVSRAYLAAATDQSREFLVLKSNSTLKDAEDQIIADSKVLFDDTQNWIYETTVKVQPGTHIKLYACYPTTDVDKALYFRGEYADDSWADVNTSELLGGSGDKWYTVRVIYDFKTNRLMTALISDFSIKEDLTINADIMVVRSHHDDAQHITIANEDVELSGVKIVYGTLQFNRWILNNRGGADNHDVNSCTIEEEDGHRVFDRIVTEQNHPALGLHEQKSLYERGLYFVSFPFDVHLSDVFGFGTYGTHWVISAYNGLRRAQRGYFMDNCVNDDCTNWDYIWEPDTFTMKANEGYLLSLDLDLMKYDNIDFWKNNRATVELYFPSMANLQTIKQVDYTMDALTDEHKCKINLNVNGDNPIADRTIKDSYWRCIGVPSFADYLGSAEWTAQNEDIPYLYEWNTVDNSLNVRSTNGFKFRSTFAYLVQNGNAIQWNAVNTQQPSQIMAKQQAAAATNYEWNISLHSQDEQVDQTYIRLTNNENVTHEFDFNQDLVKEFNYGRADIYTMIGYEPVAANSMPIENIATSVPLGIDVEKAGEYTIAMLEGTTSVGVTLVDIETGQRTNLAAGMEYTVYLAKGKHNERFMIEIYPVNNAPTDIDQLTGSDLNAEGVQKYIIDGKLIIRTAEGVVYDAQGHRL